MSPSDTTIEAMRQFLKHQFSLNGSIPLAELRRQREFVYTLHPELVDFVRDHRQAVIEVIRTELTDTEAASQHGLLRDFLLHIQAFIYKNNQFITFTAPEKTALIRLYADYMREMLVLLESMIETDFGSAFEGVVMNHLVALQAYVITLAAGRRQMDALIDKEVMCAEYSAELQLSVLNIDIATLSEPILDVGCGVHGTLVRYLRAAKLDAYGIDRLVHASPYLTEIDWLQMDFSVTAWGTIVSHMAFSNHFIFHHHSRDGVPDAFARQYMAMLRSLNVGGSLYYAPSLPFIEQFIPNSFTVVAHSGQFSSTQIVKLR
ncbi:MAG: class I SAM-dependent methyltransferase [Anaerolineae bacterium]|nr:class I SAM-dependent methyltransferase [Anaerolineae bacterium]